MWQPLAAQVVTPLPSVEKADARHSANVRSMWPPAGETMSWQVPHIAEFSGRFASWYGEYFAAWKAFGTGFAYSPRMIPSLARVTAPLKGCAASTDSTLWQK